MKNTDLNEFLHTVLKQTYRNVQNNYSQFDIEKTIAEVKFEVLTELLSVIKEDLEGLNK